MSAIDQLKATVARLRAPDGCPWDREQTHQSLCQCLVEECAELLDTIDRLDFPHMREELGDLLLHIVMQAQMAEEAGHFDFEAVATEINEKLIRRHPHVFGDMDLADTDAVLTQWDIIKAEEKAAKGQETPDAYFKDLPPRLPALIYAYELFKQADKLGARFEPIDRELFDALTEHLTEANVGATLFAMVAACRRAGIDPESALRRHCSRLQTYWEKVGLKAAKPPIGENP